METARADDPSRSNLRTVVAAWKKVLKLGDPRSEFPQYLYTAGEIRDAAVSIKDTDGILNKAISAIACPPGRHEIDAVRLGKWLTRNKDRVIDGLKICSKKNDHTKQNVWWLEQKAAAEGSP
jgi:hypothetical protein